MKFICISLLCMLHSSMVKSLAGATSCFRSEWQVPIYKVSLLREHFRIKDHNILILLAVICGNNIVSPKVLEVLRKELGCEMHNYIMWLSDPEVLDSATNVYKARSHSTILSSFYHIGQWSCCVNEKSRLIMKWLTIFKKSSSQ